MGESTGNQCKTKIRALGVLSCFEFGWLHVGTEGRFEFVPGIGVYHVAGCVKP